VRVGKPEAPSRAVSDRACGWKAFGLDSANETSELSRKGRRLGECGLEMRHATAFSHCFAGQYAESWAQAITKHAPTFQVASRAMAGLLEQARTAMTSLSEVNPLQPVSKHAELGPLGRSEDIAGWANGPRKAGLPE